MITQDKYGFTRAGCWKGRNEANNDHIDDLFLNNPDIIKPK